MLSIGTIWLLEQASSRTLCGMRTLWAIWLGWTLQCATLEVVPGAEASALERSALPAHGTTSNRHNVSVGAPRSSRDDRSGSDTAGVWRGVDASQLPNDDANGRASPFRRSPTSPTEDALVMLKSVGGNTFRMRVWNDPCADRRPGCNATVCAYSSPAGVLQMAKRCHAAGLDFVVDFHYSDWWADPGHQFKPSAWERLDFAALSDAVYSFTHQVVNALVKQGTPPKAVQIGNEITAGFLWNNSTADELCETGGRLYCKNGTANWKQFSALVQRGIDAVRSACPTAEVAIHTDLGNHIATLGITHVISWYTSLAHGIAPARFDRIGLSLYPAYTDGRTMESVAELTHLAAAFPACVVYIAETSYPAAGKRQPEALFPPTPAGQLAYLQALRTALASAMTPAQNGGLLWWEGSETSWTSLWDSDFVARPALLKGFTNT